MQSRPWMASKRRWTRSWPAADPRSKLCGTGSLAPHRRAAASRGFVRRAARSASGRPQPLSASAWLCGRQDQTKVVP
jgi:hypothetical protein